MYSKWLPWEFLKQYDNLQSKHSPVLCIAMPDFYISKLILDHIPGRNKVAGPRSNWNLKLGKELSKSWVEDHLLAPSLFDETANRLVLYAEECPIEVFKTLNNFLEDESNRASLTEKLVFVFYKENVVFKEVTKLSSIESVSIKMPPFWENHKVLDFIASEMSVQLPLVVSQYILENDENTSERFVYILGLLKQNFDSIEVKDLAQIKNLLNLNHLDQFKFTDDYGNKKILDFYRNLLPFSEQFELLRSLFSFLQSHFVKMSDPSYIEKKNRATKYDKGILQQSRIWNKTEIKKSIELFSELEILAKSKSSQLSDRLRNLYFRCQG